MNVNALRVVTHKRQTGSFVPLEPNSLHFICVAAAMGLALDLLWSDAGFKALCKYTQDLADDPAIHIPKLLDLKEGQDREIVKEFLDYITASIPNILVTRENSMETKNGRTNKFDCPMQFDPKRAAVLELNDKLVTLLADACGNAQAQESGALANFRTLLFRVGVTVAHEMVHVYTLFLRREKALHTPPHLMYGRYGSLSVGESGRYWEGNLFGGFIDMRGVKKEAIAACDKFGRKAWRLRSELINRLLARDFSWLDETLTKPDHDHQKEAVEEMEFLEWKEEYADIFPKDDSDPKDDSEQNSTQELSRSQLRELVKLNSPKFPAYNIPGANLRAFSLDPNVEVHVFLIAETPPHW